MHHYSILIIGIIIFASHYFIGLFNRTKIPDVLLLIVLGVSFRIISVLLNIDIYPLQETAENILPPIALALMLFDGGNHLKFDILKNNIRNTLILTISTYLISALIIIFLCHLIFNYALNESIFIGVVIAGISPAVVVPLVKSLKMSESASAILVSESAISDVISIILGLAVINSINHKIDFFGFIGNNLSNLFIAISIGFAGSIVWSRVLKKIRRLPNTKFTTLAFIFILYGLSETFHFNGPISVLTFSLILANAKNIPRKFINAFSIGGLIEFTHIEKSFFSEFIFLVKTFFFVYLGMTIQYTGLYHIFLGFIIIVILYAIRILLCRIILSKDIALDDSIIISYMIPKGLATAVLATYPITVLQKNIYSTVNSSNINIIQIVMQNEQVIIYKDILSLIYTMIVWSIIFTSILIYLSQSKYLYGFYKKYFTKFENPSY